jgi:hypothetical protein
MTQTSRPWFQPGIYYLITYIPYHYFNFDIFALEKLIYIFQGIFFSIAFLYLYKTIQLYCKDISKNLGFLLLASSWYIPGVLTRHSNESFSTIFIIFSIYSFLKWELSNKTHTTYRLLIFSGLFSGLAFYSRFQVAIFFIGFILSYLIYLILEKNHILKFIQNYLIGLIIALFIGSIADFIGYGKFALSPWYYFYYQLVLGVVNTFEHSPWYWFFPTTMLVTFNPFFWLMIGYSVYIHKKDKFLISLASGLFLFLFIHSLVKHKEMRFMLPMIPIVYIIITKLYSSIQILKETNFIKLLKSKVIIYPIIFVNIIIMVTGLFFSKILDGQIVGYKMPHLLADGSKLFITWNLFNSYTSSYDSLKETPYDKDMPYQNNPFYRKKEIDYIYIEESDYVKGCQEFPNNYILLASTKRALDKNNIVDNNYNKIIAEYPIGWYKNILQKISGKYYFATYRFKLLSCKDFIK